MARPKWKQAIREDGSIEIDGQVLDGSSIPKNWSPTQVENFANNWLANNNWDLRVHVYNVDPLLFTMVSAWDGWDEGQEPDQWWD